METNTQSPELHRIDKAVITEDAGRFLRLIRDKEELLDALTEANTDCKLLRERQIQIDKDNLKKSIEFEATKKSLDIVARHLEKFLDEFDGAFYANDRCASCEIAQDYIDAAKYMADNFGRINNYIRQVEEWLENYPTEKRTDKI